MKSEINRQEKRDGEATNSTPCLYLIGTPIGNLEDITIRAKRLLGEIEVIFAEDTRKTKALLSHIGASNRRVFRYSDHDRTSGEQAILRELRDGNDVGFVTDAGMPAISDPGSQLADLVIRNGFKIDVAPGPSAESMAVALSGVVNGPYMFVGFMPLAKDRFEAVFSSAANSGCSVVAYVAPHDLQRTLKILGDVIGELSRVVLCREMTKLFQSRIDLSVKELLEHERVLSPKGEYVLVVPSTSNQPRQIEEDHAIEIIKVVRDVTLSRSEKARRLTKLASISRSVAYGLLGDDGGGRSSEN